MKKLFQNYPFYFTNKKIVDFAAIEVFVDIPHIYNCETIKIENNEPFINIYFSKNDTLIAFGTLAYKVSPKDFLNDAESYKVFLNNELIDHIALINNIFDNDTIETVENLLQENNSIVIECLNPINWAYIYHIIPFSIEHGARRYKNFEIEASKWPKH